MQFTEIKIYPFYGLAQQRLQEIWVVKQQPKEQPQKSNKQDKKKTFSDRSSNGTHTTNYFASLGIFMRLGRRTQR